MANLITSSEDLTRVIAETLHHDNNTRKQAESLLTASQVTPGHPLRVLQLVASDASHVAIRQAAAVHFKNLIKKGWDVNREEGNDGIIISDNDRVTIKTHLVQLMCTTPPQIQLQLTESISLIAKVDYPQKWDNLLGELIQQFNTTDPTVLMGVLKTADSIFNSFRYVQRSDALYAVIAYTLNGIQVPLLALFKKVGQGMEAVSNDAAQLKIYLECLSIMCRIFYSLNYQDLPEFFEDHMAEFMEEFTKYLKYNNPIVVDPDEENEPGPLDNLHSSVIEILHLYGSKDEEPFLPYLPSFLQLVWNLLTNVSPLPKQDLLANSSMKFLTMLVSREMHRGLFQDETALREIVKNTVIPNLRFRESDEERFEDHPREFLVTEVEGSHSESRRRCSQDLLKEICRKFETQVTSICMEHIGAMLNDYSTDPNNKWVSKDAAVHLMMSIAIRAESTAYGVSELNPGVSLMDFFQSQIVPELQDKNHNARPVVKATSLKFVGVFRHQFNKAQLLQLIPMITEHLGSPVVVVHTFSAYTIERILMTRENPQDVSKGFVVGSGDIQAHLDSIFTALFVIIDNEELDVNDYVMKCVLRVLFTAGDSVTSVTKIVIEKLTGVLIRIAKNPQNPQFNHYVFESIALLIRNVCSMNPQATEGFEPLLFEPFTTILQQDVMEFTPYVFQILAQLLEYRPAEAGLGHAYSQLWSPLLKPDIWEKRGNIPALVRLVQAYITKASSELVPQLNPILGVFQKLLSTKGSEASAFELLNSSLIHFPQEEMAARLPTIMKLILARLQEGKTPRLAVHVTHFFALFVGRFGGKVFFDCSNNIQPGLAAMLLIQIWLPRLKTDPPTQRVPAKVQVISLTRLISETPVFLNDASGPQSFADALSAVTSILSSPTLKDHFDIKHDDIGDDVAYDNKFSNLIYASKAVEDPFKEVENSQDFFVKALHAILSTHRQSIAPILQSMDPKLQSGLDSMFKQSGLTLA
ncbi:hypothetical protein FisN_12Hh289 [Fistulifera solaris]|uniref:Importin N-terminal domain-containing protein n=1 Tax=Fistulifera solaris TaxID=1519565 RepID=A0A1Z5KC53_FISSO|nr:hypothetical protein FisN_12Hh289 [Fistulifera solaris]|eukprot:GAX23712.1 hypothetical protein FisN_12Hh289 [Fistulifera solaris]